MALIANNQASIVVQPCKQPFNLPTPLVTAKHSPILRRLLFPVGLVRCNQFYISLRPQSLIQRIAVVGFITDEKLRPLINQHIIKRLFDQLYFMRRSTCDAYGDRKTVAVRHCHEFGALATFGFPNAKPPFLALLKVPSINASRTSNPPLSLRSCARARNAFSIVPSLTHSWKRLWQVWYGGYWRGRSHQRAPVFNIQRMPSRTSRGGLEGRPGRLSEGVSNSDLRCSHCVSVSFMDTLDHISRSVSIPETGKILKVI